MAGAKNEHGLTAKQEAFCHEYLKERNATAAYRAVYNAEKMTDKSCWEQASRLLSNDKVSARISQIRAKTERKMEIDINWGVERLLRIAEAAEASGQHSAAAQATTNALKLLGLYVEKTHNTNVDETQAHLDALRKLVNEKPDLKVVNG